MTTLFKKILLIITFSMLLSIGFDFIYRKTYGLEYQFPHNLWIHPNIEEKYEIVALGNSHALEGIDFSHYGLKSISLSSAGQSFEYDLAILKMHSRQIKPGAIIIINISPISFSQENEGKNNLQYNYYGGELSPFVIPDLKIADYLQSQIFPFIRSGYLMREKYAQKTSKSLDDINQENWDKLVIVPNQEPEQKVATTIKSSKIRSKNFYNVHDILSELDSPSPVSTKKLIQNMNLIYKKWYDSEQFSEKYFAINRKDLQKLISYSQKKHWQPVLITIPISKILINGLLENYLPDYLDNNMSQINLQNLDYFNYIENKQLTNNDSLYSDSDHLNDKGAKIFSYVLLQDLTSHGYLTKDKDQYNNLPLN